MSDYTLSKTNTGAIDIQDSVDTSFSRYQPLITPQQVRDKFLFGQNLRSYMNKDVVTDELLEETILDSVEELEKESQLILFPTQIDERQPFDRVEYQTMGYFQLRKRPVHSIESLRIVTSNEQVLWEVSLDWIDAGSLAKGLMYIIPINVAVAPTATQGAAAGGAAFLAILGSQSYVPAYWRVKYTAGFPEGKVPRSVNVMIGCQTAINILNQLAATNARSNSKSLGIDGLSQSNSNAGPEIFKPAIEALELRKKKIIGKMKAEYGLKLASLGSI